MHFLIIDFSFVRFFIEKSGKTICAWLQLYDKINVQLSPIIIANYQLLSRLKMEIDHRLIDITHAYGVMQK